MPVILRPEQEEAWLDRDLDEVGFLRSLLSPYETDEMAAYEVSEMVNSPKNDYEDVSIRLPKAHSLQKSHPFFPGWDDMTEKKIYFLLK